VSRYGDCAACAVDGTCMLYDNALCDSCYDALVDLVDEIVLARREGLKAEHQLFEGVLQRARAQVAR